MELTTKLARVSHLWILIDDQIEIEESPRHERCHANIWGSEAWDNPYRGYYDKEQAIVTCHHDDGISKSFMKKLEKAFDRRDLCCCYYSGKVLVEDRQACLV